MLIAVLTVSDRCSQGLMTDTAGPAALATSAVLASLPPSDRDLGIVEEVAGDKPSAA